MNNFSDIVLSESQKEIISCAKKDGYVVSSKELHRDIQFLVELELLKYCNPQDIFIENNPEYRYVLTETGHMFLRYCYRDKLRVWYPYIVSTLALIISVIAFIRTFTA